MRAYAFILVATLSCSAPKVSSVDPGHGGAGDTNGSGGRRGTDGSGGASSGRAQDAGFGFATGARQMLYQSLYRWI